MKIIQLLVILVAILVSPLYAATDEPVKNIKTEEAAKLIREGKQNLLIVDVRTPEEFRSGHIANARNVDFFGSRFEQSITEIPKDQPVMVYCRSGRRSAEAAKELVKTGHTRVLHMEDGLAGWSRSGLPLEK